jgi:hypothetical protein
MKLTRFCSKELLTSNLVFFATAIKIIIILILTIIDKNWDSCLPGTLLSAFVWHYWIITTPCGTGNLTPWSGTGGCVNDLQSDRSFRQWSVWPDITSPPTIQNTINVSLTTLYRFTASHKQPFPKCVCTGLIKNVQGLSEWHKCKSTCLASVRFLIWNPSATKKENPHSTNAQREEMEFLRCPRASSGPTPEGRHSSQHKALYIICTGSRLCAAEGQNRGGKAGSSGCPNDWLMLDTWP